MPFFGDHEFYQLLGIENFLELMIKVWITEAISHKKENALSDE